MDCEVDFAPLDYKEPVKPQKQIKQEEEVQEQRQGVKPRFVAFAGRAKRLDEKP